MSTSSTKIETTNGIMNITGNEEALLSAIAGSQYRDGRPIEEAGAYAFDCAEIAKNHKAFAAICGSAQKKGLVGTSGVDSKGTGETWLCLLPLGVEVVKALGLDPEAIEEIVEEPKDTRVEEEVDPMLDALNDIADLNGVSISEEPEAAPEAPEAVEEAPEAPKARVRKPKVLHRVTATFTSAKGRTCHRTIEYPRVETFPAEKVVAKAERDLKSPEGFKVVHHNILNPETREVIETLVEA